MTTELRQVYRCEVCGIVTQILEGGAGELVCCGLPMQRMTERSADQGREKHVPVIEQKEDEITVKVGSVPHPMEEKHFIEWIEILDGGREVRQYLRPGQAPQAVFTCRGRKVVARGYCSLHGLWTSKP